MALFYATLFCIMKSYQIWGCLNWINRGSEVFVAGLRIRLNRMQSRPPRKTGSGSDYHKTTQIRIQLNKFVFFSLKNLDVKVNVIVLLVLYNNFSKRYCKKIDFRDILLYERMRSCFQPFFDYRVGSNLFRHPDPQPWTLCGQWKSFVRGSLFCNLALISLQSKEHLSLPGWSQTRDGPDIKFSAHQISVLVLENPIWWCIPGQNTRSDAGYLAEYPAGLWLSGRIPNLKSCRYSGPNLTPSSHYCLIILFVFI